MEQVRNFKAKGSLRFYTALWAGKMAKTALKALGRNATHFPGKVIGKICPDFIDRVGKPQKIICVTGTNGKTTVSNMLVDILSGKGYSVTNNRAGSNIKAGVTTALLNGATLSGKSRNEWGVLECDERSSMYLYPYIKPDYMICTNLNRDSVSRNAHPEYIRDIISDNTQPNTHLILHAEDPISSHIAPSNPRTYFGLKRLAEDTDVCTNHLNDCRICPECGTRLEFEYVRYFHMGRCKCPNCDFKTPEPDYEAEIFRDEGYLILNEKGKKEKYDLVSNTVFNITNQVTVTTVLRKIGFTADELREAFSRLKIVDTRFNTIEARNLKIVDQMAKGHNAAACSIIFDYVSKEKEMKDIVMFMDVGDAHENMTWMYEADYERLNDPNIRRIIIPGMHAADQKLRLLMAGVPKEKIITVPEWTDVPNAVDVNGIESVYILHQALNPTESHKIAQMIAERADNDAEFDQSIIKSDDSVQSGDEDVTNKLTKEVKIETLYPEVASLFGDIENITYLKKCIPTALFIDDSLNEEPFFVKNDPDLVYLGPMTERKQELVIKKLKPYKDRIKELIDKGVIFLSCGNAMEVFFKKIENEDGTGIDALGLFDYTAKRRMFNRYNRSVLGKFSSHPIVGFKSQFAFGYGDNSNEYFFEVQKGCGLNEENMKEGIRVNNFFGTHMIGPVLILNPFFTKYLIGKLTDTEPENITVAYEKEAMEAYEKRVELFNATRFIDIAE